MAPTPPQEGPIIKQAKQMLGLKEDEVLTHDLKHKLANRLNLSQEGMSVLLSEDGERVSPLKFQQVASEAGFESIDDFKHMLDTVSDSGTFELPFIEKQSLNIFVSYAHHPLDTACLDRIRVHLAPLAKGGLDLWDDSRIKVGDDWNQEIENALSSAHAAILLVSADFLASTFITNNELPPLLKKAKKEGVLIIPVIIKPCGYADDPDLVEYQALNSPDSPILGMTEIEQEYYWDKLRKRILEFMEDHPDMYRARLGTLPHVE